MAKLALIYGMRLLPEDDLGELQDAKTLLGLAWAGVPLWEGPRPR